VSEPEILDIPNISLPIKYYYTKNLHLKEEYVVDK